MTTSISDLADTASVPTRAALAAEAADLGFDDFGVTTANHNWSESLDAFLAAGYPGDMAWLAARAEQRGSPKKLWPDAKSVICLAMNYGPEIDPLAILDQKDRGAISVYAQGRDYHDVFKKRLKKMARWMVAEYGCEVKVFVDTAPVMEKPLAAAAGLGWQGKHSNLVSQSIGSWLFLGEIFTDFELPVNGHEDGPANAAPENLAADHCGTCHACLDICPTNAMPAPYQLDPRRCISYLTIEHKGHIPLEFRAAIGNRIYGCDDCLAVCPWNKYATPTDETAFLPRESLVAPRLAELAGLDNAAFCAMFSGSPIKRTGRDRFVRNVLIALGNSGDSAAKEAVMPRIDDQSPLVRGAAVWALSQLLGPGEFESLAKTRAAIESDSEVVQEWAMGGSNK
jgi:epoxyqueuosine reductase